MRILSYIMENDTLRLHDTQSFSYTMEKYRRVR